MVGWRPAGNAFAGVGGAETEMGDAQLSKREFWR